MLGKYKMGTISRLSGYSPALLRVWEQRHSILDPVRTDSGHRLYTDDDLAVLRRVRTLMDEGLSIGEIARRGRPSLLLDVKNRANTEAPVIQLGDESQREMERCRQDLVEGAVAIDGERIRRALDRAFALVSPDTAIERVIIPGCMEIGDLWAEGRCSVAGEHLASRLMIHRLQNLVGVAKSLDLDAPRIICACFPDELHEIGLLLTAYFLGRKGHRVDYLGAALPFEELERACALLAPASVYLSVTRRALFDMHKPRLVELLGRWAGRTQFVIGGQGVDLQDLSLRKAGAQFAVPMSFSSAGTLPEPLSGRASGLGA